MLAGVRVGSEILSDWLDAHLPRALTVATSVGMSSDDSMSASQLRQRTMLEDRDRMQDECVAAKAKPAVITKRVSLQPKVFSNAT